MTLSYGFVAYIDEAGDDGIGKFKKPGEGGQSHWLALNATLISAENETKVVQWRDEISNAFPKRRRRDIHFQDLDHAQRVFATSLMARKPLGLVSVLSNKTTIAKTSSFEEACQKERNVLYKYVLRYLLERLTLSIKHTHQLRPGTTPMLKIIFSRRGGMDYRDFQAYLEHLKGLQQARGSYFPIHWDYISPGLIVSEDHSKVAGLQLADIAASSFYQAVEPNFYGQTEPRYALLLRDRVLAHPTSKIRLNHGVKPIPEPSQMALTDEQIAFFDLWKAGG